MEMVHELNTNMAWLHQVCVFCLYEVSVTVDTLYFYSYIGSLLYAETNWYSVQHYRK